MRGSVIYQTGEQLSINANQKEILQETSEKFDQQVGQQHNWKVNRSVNAWIYDQSNRRAVLYKFKSEGKTPSHI